MKKILIPTDFSEFADNATQYAIEVAAEFKSEIYLYHVYYIHKIDYHLDVPSDDQPYKKQVERSMKRARLKFQDKILQKGLTLQTRVEPGSTLSLFRDVVKEHGFDLIIMGTQGASGLTKVFFGSFAAEAVKSARIPVMVIPPECTFHPLKHIVLAIDNKDVSPEVLLPLQKLASKFGAKVTVFHLKTDLNKGIDKMIHRYLENIEIVYHEEPKSKDINEHINEFIIAEGCDLLCMVRRKKSFFENIFKRSTTKNQVFNSKVPLLVLLSESKS